MTPGIFISVRDGDVSLPGVFFAARGPRESKVVIVSPKANGDGTIRVVENENLTVIDDIEMLPAVVRENLELESRAVKLAMQYAPGVVMQKADAAQAAHLVKRMVPVKGKHGTYYAIRMVDPKVFARTATKRAKQKPKGADKEVRINESTMWFKHMQDGLDDLTYRKIQTGDADALAKHVFSKFFVHNPDTHETLANRIAHSIPRGYAGAESYEIEDVLQETMYQLIRQQQKGVFQKNDKKFFPATVAKTIVNVGRSLQQRAKKEEQKGRFQRLAADISELADYLDALADAPEDQFIASEQIQQARKDFQQVHKAVRSHLQQTSTTPALASRNVRIYNAWAVDGKEQRAIGKELGMSDGAVGNILTRARRVITEQLKPLGYAPNANSFRSASVEFAHTAPLAKADAPKTYRIRWRNGSAVLLKAELAEPLPQITFQGIPIVIENTVGSVRTGENPDGTAWRTVFFYPYGFIATMDGTDNEELDVYVGPNANAPEAYIVHQNVNGQYDEDKVMLGFNSPDEARAAYEQHYDKPGFFGGMTVVDMDRFRFHLGLLTKAEGRPGLIKKKIPVKRSNGRTILVSRWVKPGAGDEPAKKPGLAKR